MENRQDLKNVGNTLTIFPTGFVQVKKSSNKKANTKIKISVL